MGDGKAEEGLLAHEAEIERQIAFMSAVQLIQDRDTVKASSRIEMLLSQLLEGDLAEYKKAVMGVTQ